MANSLHSETIKVGKLDIHYLTGGEGDPLVIIHGAGNGAEAWLNNAIELTKYYSVYVPDLPGFGHSQSMGDDFHLPEFVGFVEDFSQSLGLEQFHLLGHSIGGCITLHYAFQFPHKIKKLVLVSSFCLGKEIALWVRFLSRQVFGWSIGETILFIQKTVRWVARLLGVPFEFVSFVSRIRVNIGNSITTLKGQAIVLQNRLSELLVPTLLVWGAKDGIVPASHAYTAAQLIPDSQLHVFEGRGHSPHKQNAEEFSTLLARFLG